MMFKKYVIPAICGAVLALSFMFNTYASQVTPGSAEDPVVTKSYVDALISQVSGTKGNNGSLSEYEMEFIIDEVISRMQDSDDRNLSGEAYVPVNLKQGQVLIGHEGCEIILRSGRAVAYTQGSDGLANVTTGEDAVNNNEVGRNQLLIVPRDDGRGVKAINDIWLLVKGGYSIID